jgi:hypothetical protein
MKFVEERIHSKMYEVSKNKSLLVVSHQSTIKSML